MIDRELMTSDKFGASNLEGRALYAPLYAFANRDGRLEGRRRKLWAKTGAADLMDLEPFERAVAELVRVDLLRECETEDGRPFLQIVGFDKHQTFNYLDEPVGEWTLTEAERVPPRKRKGEDGAGLGQDVRAGGARVARSAPGREGEVEDELKRKVKVNRSADERPPSSPVWTEEDYDRERSRIRQSWIRTRPEANSPNAMGLRPAEREMIEEAARERLCLDWRTEAELDARFTQTRAELLAGGYTASPKAILNNMRRERAAPVGSAGPSRHLAEEDRRVEAEKRKTRELIESMGTPEELQDARERGPRLPPGMELIEGTGPLAGAVGGTLAKIAARREATS